MVFFSIRSQTILPHRMFLLFKNIIHFKEMSGKEKFWIKTTELYSLACDCSQKGSRGAFSPRFYSDHWFYFYMLLLWLLLQVIAVTSDSINLSFRSPVMDKIWAALLKKWDVQLTLTVQLQLTLMLIHTYLKSL